MSALLTRPLAAPACLAAAILFFALGLWDAAGGFSPLGWLLSLLTWAAAALSVEALARRDFEAAWARQAQRLGAAAIFGVTILALWELIVTGFEVPQVLLPAPSMIGARIAGSLPILWDDVVQTFLRHALRDGFFHADMHQGNLKLGPDGRLIILDFGIMGRIDPYTRRVYAEILLGFLRKDYRRVAEVHFEAGYVPADQDLETFAQALRSIGEPIFGQQADRISMARLLAHLFDVTERFGMQTRTELILLQRTMVVVEGVGRTLDPHLNIWTTAQPVVEEWMKDNLGPAQIWRDARETAKVLARFGPRLPEIAERALTRLAEEETRAAPPAPGRALWLSAGAGVLGGAAGAAAVLALLG